MQTTSGPLLSLRTAAPSQKNSPATVSFVLHARHKKTEEFMLKGPGQEVILQMLFFAYRASVDIEGLRPGIFFLPVQVTSPARVGVINVEPPTVRVRIK